jgi:paired amphipathic helix protein Sin3a
MTHPTEWLPEPKDASSPVFLRRYGNDDLIEGCLSVECIYRCLREAAEDGTAPVVDDHMRVRVSVPSYKLVYEAGCEDFIWRNEGGILETRAMGRDEERRRSRWLCG